MKNKLFRKLFNRIILKRIYVERAGEPLIYNLVSLYYFIFGSFVKKIEYDLVPRQPYAFGLDDAFKNAKKEGVSEIIIIEFGVAAGAGIYNLKFIAEKLSNIYNVNYKIYGFDTGMGMPPPVDYRDHPEKYYTGDFPSGKLQDQDLPENVAIIYGRISETLPEFKKQISSNARIAFVSIDVDYYSSTMECLEIFKWEYPHFLSKVTCYFDDVNNLDHNKYCGELLAIDEFNDLQLLRKICRFNQLRNWRFFKNALWLDQMYYLHVFDSPLRSDIQNKKNISVLSNPFLD